MYPLNDQQIAFILRDITARGITMEDLRSNLLDHICIIIEENLEEGGNFELFYASAITSFYKNELCEIEEETQFLLTGKNIFSMKKAMIISGTFSVTAFLGSSLFRILHVELADFVLFLGFMSFVFVFLPLLFIVKFREAATPAEKLILTSGSIAGSLYFFCMLLKFLGPSWPPFLGRVWPNIGMIWLTLWLIGLGIGMFVFLPVYFLSGTGKSETRTNTIVISIVLIVFTGIQFRFTSLKPLEYRAPHVVRYDRSDKPPGGQADLNKIVLVSDHPAEER